MLSVSVLGSLPLPHPMDLGAAPSDADELGRWHSLYVERVLGCYMDWALLLPFPMVLPDTTFSLLPSSTLICFSSEGPRT